MPDCRTRSWRCATARWAGAWPASPATRARTGVRRLCRRRPWNGRAARRSAWRKAAASSASIAATLDAWRADAERTLYVFDVRDPAEYEAGHFPGAISAPGGQLVQATDQYVGTLGARIVLVDDAEVRAAMTASWLRQMGWQRRLHPDGDGNRDWLARAPAFWRRHGVRTPPSIARRSSELLSRKAATVVDLSLSRNYLARHIPGAWFAIRTRLARAFEKIPVARHAGAHLGRWRAGEAGGRRSGAFGRSPGAFSRRRQRRLAGGRQAHFRRSAKWPTTLSINGASPTNARRHQGGDGRISGVGDRSAAAHRARRLLEVLLRRRVDARRRIKGCHAVSDVAIGAPLPRRAWSITLSSARNTSVTPSPLTAEITRADFS